jgi:hypothetical protein
MKTINIQIKNNKKPEEPLSYIETLSALCVLVFVCSIFSFLPTPLLIIISMVLIFITIILFIGFIALLINKEHITNPIQNLLLLLTMCGITTWYIVSIVNTGYYTAKPEEITFLGNPSNHSEIKELTPGKRFLPLSKIYTFPQKTTYGWEVIIRPGKDALLQRQQKSKYIFSSQLIFDVNLTKEKALELLITYKSDLETIIYAIVRPNIQNSLNQLSQTLSLSNFSNQKEQIEKEITNIVNKELNSVGLSDHAILWLKLGDSPKIKQTLIGP